MTIKGEVFKRILIIKKLITLVNNKEHESTITLLDEPLNSFELIDKVFKVLGSLDPGQYNISKADLDKIL